jgi:hypothetical protein
MDEDVSIDFSKIDSICNDIKSELFRQLFLPKKYYEDPFFEIMFSSVNYAFVNFKTRRRPHFSLGGETFLGSEALYRYLKYKYDSIDMSCKIKKLNAMRLLTKEKLPREIHEGLSDAEYRMFRLEKCTDLIVENFQYINDSIEKNNISELMDVINSWGFYNDPLKKQLQLIAFKIIMRNEHAFIKNRGKLEGISLLVDYRIPAYLIDKGFLIINNKNKSLINNGFVFSEDDAFVSSLRWLTYFSGKLFKIKTGYMEVEIDQALWSLSRVNPKTEILINTMWF